MTEPVKCTQAPVTVSTPVATTVPAGTPVIVQPTAPGGMSEAQVKELVEKARKEEKEKLYSEVDKKKQELKGAQGQLKGMESQIESMENNQTEGYKALEGKVDQLTTALAVQRQETAFKEKEASDTKEKAKLDAFMSARISEIGKENLIVELVGGNNEEEINQSILIAEARMKTIKEAAEKEAAAKLSNTPTPPITNPGATGPSGSPGAPPPTGGLPVELSAETISKMSTEDYAKHRDQIKKEVATTMNTFYQSRTLSNS